MVSQLWRAPLLGGVVEVLELELEGEDEAVDPGGETGLLEDFTGEEEEEELEPLEASPLILLLLLLFLLPVAAENADFL